MILDVITLFPAFFDGPLGVSMLARAERSGALRVGLVNLRDYAEGPHRQVDDTPFGGGPGMVLKPDPLFAAVEDVRARRAAEGAKPRVVLLSPQGAPFRQETAVRLAGEAALALVCGHYKAEDERVREGGLVDEELSIGDYVLTGGETAALVVIDAVARLLPGVLGDEESYQTDSFYTGLLDGPHYTRPRVFRGLAVPEVLLQGDHEKIRRWRRLEALRRTLERRPDLLQGRVSDAEELQLLSELRMSELRRGERGHGQG